MTYTDWLIGALVTFFLAVTVVLLWVASGAGDKKRDRAELRRAAKRAEEARE